MNRLKVVHFLGCMGGGAIRSTLDLAIATKDEVENIFIILENKNIFDIEFDRYILVKNRKKYKKLDILGDIILSKKLNKLLKKIKPDIVISHVETTAKILKYIDIPKAYYIRTDLSKELDSLKKRSYFRYLKRKFLYKRVLNDQHILTISKEIKGNILSFIKPKTIQTLYNPFDKEKIINLSKKIINDIKEPYMIYVGHSSKEKREDILLEAFSKIKRDIKLLLVGIPKENREKLISFAKNLKIENKIIIKNFTPNPYPYIKNAKLLVLSSEREGLPRVLVEALILKTPIVSTNCQTGPKELLVEELSKYLARVNDPNDLAKKIDMALASYPTIKDDLVSKFDKKEIKEKYIKGIQDIIHRG